MRQKDAAEQLSVTQCYISMVLEQAEEKIAKHDSDQTPDGIAWRYWKQFVKKGYMPEHVDVEIEYALFPRAVRSLVLQCRRPHSFCHQKLFVRQ